MADEPSILDDLAAVENWMAAMQVNPESLIATSMKRAKTRLEKLAGEMRRENVEMKEFGQRILRSRVEKWAQLIDGGK